jgi:hypothetical protein
MAAMARISSVTRRGAARQVAAGQEGIVLCIQHQGRHGDVVQDVLGAGAVPVVVRVAVAVQGRRDDVVEGVQVARGQHGVAREQAGKLLQLGQAFRFQGVQNMRV